MACLVACSGDHVHRARGRMSCIVATAPPVHAPATVTSSDLSVSADIMAEVLQIIFCNLDCEGTRKLASVNKLFRTRSYSAIAVAEFRESQIRLLGLFQNFQVAALREGRVRTGAVRGGKKNVLADGRRAFLAKIEDNNSLAELASDVESLTTLEAAAAYAAKHALAQLDPLVQCGTLKAHANCNGVRLPLNLSMSLRSSLSDQERRLLALGEAFQKKVLCTFKVGKQHGGGNCSAKCVKCSRYACTECQEAQRCSSCHSSYCTECWEQGSPDMCGICHESVCSDCREQALTASENAATMTKSGKRCHAQECVLCPVFVRGHTCISCAKLPHCAACDRHCTAQPRACDSCGEKSCDDCILDSPYCQLCGEFSLW